jgi:hypothetical protein
MGRLEALPVEVLSLICDYLDVRSRLLLGGASTLLYGVTRAGKRWSWYECWSGWVKDSLGVRRLMRETGAVCSGRWVTEWAVLGRRGALLSDTASLFLPLGEGIVGRWKSFLAGQGYRVREQTVRNGVEWYRATAGCVEGPGGTRTFDVYVGYGPDWFEQRCKSASDAAFMTADEVVVFFPRVSMMRVPGFVGGCGQSRRHWLTMLYGVGILVPTFGGTVAGLLADRDIAGEKLCSFVFGAAGRPECGRSGEFRGGCRLSVFTGFPWPRTSQSGAPFQAWRGVSGSRARENRRRLAARLADGLE